MPVTSYLLAEDSSIAQEEAVDVQAGSWSLQFAGKAEAAVAPAKVPTVNKAVTALLSKIASGLARRLQSWGNRFVRT